MNTRKPTPRKIPTTSSSKDKVSELGKVTTVPTFSGIPKCYSQCKTKFLEDRWGCECLLYRASALVAWHINHRRSWSAFDRYSRVVLAESFDSQARAHIYWKGRGTLLHIWRSVQRNVLPKGQEDPECSYFLERSAELVSVRISYKLFASATDMGMSSAT